ncbi:MAG: hypothetical protein K1X92_15695 [Bacteroidia bacterium]|nr:hypothetical protein [Bacteroidia bacterium]
MHSFYVKIYLYPTENGGRKRPVLNGYRPNIGFSGGNVTDGVLRIRSECINPGETHNGILSFYDDLNTEQIVKTNTLFTIQEGEKIIGCGTILRRKELNLIENRVISKI